MTVWDLCVTSVINICRFYFSFELTNYAYPIAIEGGMAKLKNEV